MGGAFLARADDATAASWNPAGLSYLRHPEISGVFTGGALISHQMLPTGDAQVDQRRGSTPDFFAAAYPFEWGSLSGASQVSFQRVISFSNHRTFTNLTGADFFVDSSGGFDVFALGTGVQIGRKIRVGATLNRWLNGYDQVGTKASAVRLETFETNFALKAWNTNLGVILNPWESLNLGAVFKSPYTGSVILEQSRSDALRNPVTKPITSSQSSAGLSPVSLDFPGAIGVGLSWRPKSTLTLSFDYTRTFWSRGRIRNFFTLPPPVTLPNGPTTSSPAVSFASLPYPTLSDFEQKDTQQFRTGVEYVLLGQRVKWPIRAGAFSDAQYFRASDGDPPLFLGWTVGTGLIVGPVLLDIAYVHETGSYGDLEGIQNNAVSHRVFASLIYRYSHR
jgi:long-subunit fatty acid transport protein